MVKLLEHPSAEYPPRTFYNAALADATAAFYMDDTTAGERLTKKSARIYCGFYLGKEWEYIATDLLHFVRIKRIKNLNVAGNGIYTFKKLGHSQEEVNQCIYNILHYVHERYQLKKIISGGQTGVDWAAGVAAYVLKIPCEMTFPRGFRQRDEHGEIYLSKKNLERCLKMDAKQIKI